MSFWSEAKNPGFRKRVQKKTEREEHRFAEILRLQQLPLRMTERRIQKRKIGKGSGFFASLENDTKKEPNPLTPFPVKEEGTESRGDPCTQWSIPGALGLPLSPEENNLTP